MRDEDNKLQREIDSDKGLNSKKRLLIVASLVLLGIQFSGATIEEANTFILKLKFTHQNGLAMLLFYSICFLMVRYYSYARKYHNKLYDMWSSELMSDPRIEYYDEHQFELYGWLHEKYPRNFDPMQCGHDDMCSYKTRYKRSSPFMRYFQFDISNEHENYSDYINIYKCLGFKKYMRILGIEIKCWFLSYFKNRENLDILAPYVIGLMSLTAFIYPDELRQLLG